MKEFSTPERTLAREDESGSELEFEVDFKHPVTPMSPRIYKEYTRYIEQKLAWSIKEGFTLTPTTGRLLEKRDKANKLNLLTSKLAIEELFKKRQAELDKIRPNGERVVQQFGTIKVGDAHLQIAVRNHKEEEAIAAIQAQKEASALKKREYREAVDKHKAERLAKKTVEEAEKAARKAARVAKIAE